MTILPRTFYEQSTLKVARQLLGMHLCHQDGEFLRIGKIVETEAYLGPHDLASHSSKGRTPRTEVMFGPAGYAYVYLIYGFWYCFNVVTRREGCPQAVLIRALEPLQNISEKTWGPGLLCKAMHIDKTLNKVDLCGSMLWIEKTSARLKTIRQTTRIGVDYAGSWAEKPWRFYDADSPYVSTFPVAQRKRLLKI